MTSDDIDYIINEYTECTNELLDKMYTTHPVWAGVDDPMDNFQKMVDDVKTFAEEITPEFKSDAFFQIIYPAVVSLCIADRVSKRRQE